MDTQNNENIDTNLQSSPVPDKPAKPAGSMNTVWLMVIVLMGLFALGTLFYVYSQRNMSANTYKTQPSATMTNELSQTQPPVNVVQQDMKKDESQVNDEVIKDIEGISTSPDDTKSQDQTIDGLGQ